MPYRLPLVLLLVITTSLAPARAADVAPVVVELYTSEGCSSCPPAEELFAKLVAEPGAPLVALTFNVDYWNKLGWTDPFSRPEWSRRQGRYAAALAADQVYTPQLVVDGVAECVGSDEPKVRTLLESARKRPHLARVTVKPGKIAGGKWPVTVKYEASTKIESGPATLVVVLFEDNLASDVKSGENAGQKLPHQRIVRALVESPTGPAGEASVELAIDPSWNVAQLGVATFVQDAKMRIHGAAVERP